MNLKYRLAALIGAGTLVLTFSACSMGNRTPVTNDESEVIEKVEDNTDPKDGSVRVFSEQDQTITKRCDGPTLVYVSDGYYNGGIAVIPDSRECVQ